MGGGGVEFMVRALDLQEHWEKQKCSIFGLFLGSRKSNGPITSSHLIQPKMTSKCQFLCITIYEGSSLIWQHKSILLETLKWPQKTSLSYSHAKDQMKAFGANNSFSQNVFMHSLSIWMNPLPSVSVSI